MAGNSNLDGTWVFVVKVPVYRQLQVLFTSGSCDKVFLNFSNKLCYWYNNIISSFVAFAEKDWEDIKFGVDNQIDFYAVSFVKDAKVVNELKDYLKS